jgi:hypothetical protein
MTGFQLADSAKAPWTRAIVGFGVDMGLLLLWWVVGVGGSVGWWAADPLVELG